MVENVNKEWFSDYKELILLNKVKDAQKVLLDNIDKNQVIYRYSRGLNRDLCNWENKQLWLSSAFYFNDPYDESKLLTKSKKRSYGNIYEAGS